MKHRTGLFPFGFHPVSFQEKRRCSKTALWIVCFHPPSHPLPTLCRGISVGFLSGILSDWFCAGIVFPLFLISGDFSCFYHACNVIVFYVKLEFENPFLRKKWWYLKIMHVSLCIESMYSKEYERLWLCKVLIISWVGWCIPNESVSCSSVSGWEW